MDSNRKHATFFSDLTVQSSKSHRATSNQSDENTILMFTA